MAAVERNPKDSMKSTWRQAPKKTWGIAEWTFTILGINPTTLNKPIPVFKKTDPIPIQSDLHAHIWILVHAAWPMLLQQIYASYYGRNLSLYAVFTLYSLAYTINGALEMRLLRRLGHKYGFFDGENHKRDEVPNIGTFQVFCSLLMTSHIRPLMTLFLSYRTSQQPKDMNLITATIEAGLYGIILDFFFYWYHRFMHENDGLWRFHRTHHLTKHPNALLTLYAGHEQEFFDIVGIPLMTYGTMRLMGFPMGFYEWWICHQYVVWSELYGHSGVRIYGRSPSPFQHLLRIFDAEILTEDHDLHHRKGWRNSHNYGKQTMLWDRIFGTFYGKRYEQVKEQIDYNNYVKLMYE